MKYLILTEGRCELALLTVLINQGLFKIDVSDMLDEKVFHKRQLDEYIYTLIRSLPKSEKITIIRIGDTMKDEIKISANYLAWFVDEVKICTKPELEILIILNEGLLKEFNKTSVKPSIFLRMQKIGYSKNYEYMCAYFAQINLQELLQEYKRIKHHLKDEHYLADYLK